MYINTSLKPLPATTPNSLSSSNYSTIQTKMSFTKFVCIFMLISPTILQVAVGDVFSPLSPLFSPVLNGICDSVDCGEGQCKVSSNHTFGFFCECKAGWSKLHLGDLFQFLPCVIPNCSIDYSCTKSSVAPAPAPAQAPPKDLSFFDSCKWSYCGGGKCSVNSTYGHKCTCNEGYSNLFNSTKFPCYADCSLGANCANLGITLSNSSAASPGNLSDVGSSSAADSSITKNALWLFISVISVAVVQLI